MAELPRFCNYNQIYPKNKNPKIHIISDRGSYNTSKKTREAAKTEGIVLHFLPSYSPNLNPIERLWKVMNEYARNNQVFKTGKEFKEKINSFLNEMWPTIADKMHSRINDNFERIKSVVCDELPIHTLLFRLLFLRSIRRCNAIILVFLHNFC